MRICSSLIFSLFWSSFALVAASSEGKEREKTDTKSVAIGANPASPVDSVNVFRRTEVDSDETYLNETFLQSDFSDDQYSNETFPRAELLQAVGPDEPDGPNEPDEPDGPNLVFGGVNSPFGAFPYYVDINGCGGSLIHPRVVLSAASCNVDDSGAFTMAPVYIGESVTILGAGSMVSTGQIATVVNQIIHPNFVEGSVNTGNDFMLLILDRDIIISDIPFLQLSRNEDNIEPGTELVITGTGATSNTVGFSDTLQVSTVFAVSDSFCQQAFPDTNFCAGVNSVFAPNPTNICLFDEGSPILRADGDVHFLVGVASFSLALVSCDGVAPQVFSQIPGNENGYDWIRDTVCYDLGFFANFCGGNKCVCDDDCNLGYDCVCLGGDIGDDDDDDFGGKGKGYGRFLTEFARELYTPKDEIGSQQDESKSENNYKTTGINPHGDKRRILQSKGGYDSYSAKGYSVKGGKKGKGYYSYYGKGCKGLKGCKSGGHRICVDNRELFPL